MVEFFTESELSDSSKTFLMGLPPQLFTPAELSKLLFEHIGESVEVILESISGIARQKIDNSVESVVHWGG